MFLMFLQFSVLDLRPPRGPDARSNTSLVFLWSTEVFLVMEKSGRMGGSGY